MWKLITEITDLFDVSKVLELTQTCLLSKIFRQRSIILCLSVGPRFKKAGLQWCSRCSLTTANSTQLPFRFGIWSNSYRANIKKKSLSQLGTTNFLWTIKVVPNKVVHQGPSSAPQTRLSSIQEDHMAIQAIYKWHSVPIWLHRPVATKQWIHTFFPRVSLGNWLCHIIPA